MCGIAGIICRDRGQEPDADTLGVMLRFLAHRGPDDEGSHFNGPVALGCRRLAIIDLQAGHQPMCNEDASIWIVCNGEIYNYVELRAELAASHTFRTVSDTEVILHLYEDLGERCLERLNGMFAFAIWDARQQRIFAARDRIGIKPFYWTLTPEALVFASEPKALLAAGFAEPDPDPEGLQQYLTFQFCLGPRTLFRQISRLEPGHYLSFRPSRDSRPNVVRYWDYNFGMDDEHTEDYFRETLRELLADSIRLQLRSDVSVGAHLSGGIDSSTVVSLAGRQHTQRLRTFSGAFRDGPEYDETRYARAVAEMAGSEHFEVWPTAREFTEIMPWLIFMMDEPAAGPGLFPQYCVSKLASEHVKVVLGGQGGDELFGGYARYLIAYLEQTLHGAIFGVDKDAQYVATWENIAPSLPLLRQYRPLLQRFWSHGLFEDMGRRYFRLVTRVEDAESLVSGDFWDSTTEERMYASFSHIFHDPSTSSYFNRMTHFDLKTMLPALLQVEDRTSMSVSMESRVPLLDHRIAELVTRMPPAVRFKGGDSKRIFREAVEGTIPHAVFSRRDKMGFPVPLTEWLRGPIRDFVRDTLLGSRARSRGIFRPEGVERVLRDDAPFDRQLWGMLSLELWFQAFVDRDRLPRRPSGRSAVTVAPA